MMNLNTLVSMARNGGNPLAVIQQMAGQDPRMAQAMKIIGGKTPAQLQEIAANMAKERGMTIEQVRQRIGL